jgi:hypothetical protein
LDAQRRGVGGFSRADYESPPDRIGDADDAAMFDARKGEWETRGVVLPPEVSAAMLRGDGRLTAIRHRRDETQLQLGSKTRIGRRYLPDLESGRRRGTPETIAKLAQAFAVLAEWLL